MIKIAVFDTKNGSTYDVLNHFTRSFTKALQEEGVDARYYGTGKISEMKEIPDLTLSFFPPPADEKEHLLCDLLRTPHLWYSVDSLDYVSSLRSPYLITSTRDDNSHGLLHRMGHKNPLLLYHAADKEIVFDELSERPYDITLLGSTLKSQHAEAIYASLSPLQKELLLKAKNLFFKDQKITYYEAFLKVCQDSDNVSLRDLKHFNLPQLMMVLELQIRHEDRISLLSSIKNIPIHVFGRASRLEKESWEELLASQDNFIFHDKVDFSEAIEVMKKSKIILNSIPTINYGGHERLFYSLMAGALPITTVSPFIDRNFKDEESVLTYRPLEWDRAEPKIKKYLDNEPLRERAAQKGREIVLAHHTWNHRARELLNSTVVKNIILSKNK